MKNVVELKLIENWLGHPPGSIVRVGDIQAKLMIERRVAIINEGGDISGTKETAKEESITSSAQANKQEEKVAKMQKRNMDKMIKDSVNKHV